MTIRRQEWCQRALPVQPNNISLPMWLKTKSYWSVNFLALTASFPEPSQQQAPGNNDDDGDYDDVDSFSDSDLMSTAT